MKITDLKAYAIKGRGYPRYPWIFVEVETDAGISGLGESLVFRRTGGVEIIHTLKSALVGEDPFNVEKLLHKMPRAGASPEAMSGIEIALWDIIGKSLGVPVYMLLGGRCRDKVRVYCDGFFRGGSYNPKEYAAAAKDAVSQGFTAIKMDLEMPSQPRNEIQWAFTNSDMQLAVNILAAIRKEVGPGIDILVDCHNAYSDVATALTVAEKLAPFNLMWLEDPVRAMNVAEMAMVARRANIRIAADAAGLSRRTYTELCEAQAAQIIMPDIARSGGILELKKISAIAETHGILVAPHNMCGPIATAASVQLCTCIANFLILEHQLGDVDYRDELLENPLRLKAGHLQIPDGPGLGVSLNRKAIEKYRVA